VKQNRNSVENQFLKTPKNLSEVCEEKNKKSISKNEENPPQHKEIHSLGEKTGIFRKFGRFLVQTVVKFNSPVFRETDILFLGNSEVKISFYFYKNQKFVSRNKLSEV